MLRVGGFDTPYPPARLEDDYLPDLDRILDAVDRSLGVLREGAHVTELKQFKLPDVGEGLTEAEIVSWHVKPGDTVEVNDSHRRDRDRQGGWSSCPARTTAWSPSCWWPRARPSTSARRSSRSTSAGDGGRPGGGAAAGASASAAAARSGRDRDRPVTEEAVEPGLVGGPAPGGQASAPRRLRRRARPQAAARSADRRPGRSRARPRPAAAPATAAPAPAPGSPGRRRPAVGCWPSRRCASSPRTSASTSPTSRRPARTASITRDDVEQAAAEGTAGDGAAAAAPRAPGRPGGAAAASARRASRSRGCASTRRRRWSRQRVHRAARHRVPHRRRHRDDGGWSTGCGPDREFADVRVVAAGCSSPGRSCSRSRRHPEINASWDEARQEIVVKHYVNLGIAAATDRGLIVPNIKDADALTLPELAARSATLAATARAGQDPAGRHARRARSRSPTSASSASTPAPRSCNPGRGGDPRLRRRSASMPWVAQGQGARRAAGHPAGAVLRPPAGRRRAGLAGAGRRRRGAGGPGPRAGDELLIKQSLPAQGGQRLLDQRGWVQRGCAQRGWVRRRGLGWSVLDETQTLRGWDAPRSRRTMYLS